MPVHERSGRQARHRPSGHALWLVPILRPRGMPLGIHRMRRLAVCRTSAARPSEGPTTPRTAPPTSWGGALTLISRLRLSRCAGDEHTPVADLAAPDRSDDGAFLVGTVFSLTYNAVTGTPWKSPAGLSHVQTGKLRTRYLEWGTTGPPVVLVHGFVESADTWADTAPRIAAAGHRVYALDLDGWGYSQRVAPFDAAHQSTQLLDFITALHLHPVLVGHSSGAAIVAMAALHEPSTIGAVMFLDGDALATGAGAKFPLTKLLVDPYRTTILRLIVRSHFLVSKVYDSTCGPTCPPIDADQWQRPLQVAGAEHALWAMVHQGVLIAGTRTIPAIAAPSHRTIRAGERVLSRKRLLASRRSTTSARCRMSSVKISKFLGAQQPNESMEAYVRRLASRGGSLGVMFLPAAFRALVDLYGRTDDLNSRIRALEAERGTGGSSPSGSVEDRHR